MIFELPNGSEFESRVVVDCCYPGSEVICSETVMNPVQMYADDHTDSSSVDGHEDDEMRFIFTIRFVFFLI